jgi:hypothetical protein
MHAAPARREAPDTLRAQRQLKAAVLWSEWLSRCAGERDAA